MAPFKIPIICNIFNTSSRSSKFLKLTHNFHLQKSIVSRKLCLSAKSYITSYIRVNVSSKKYFLLQHAFCRQFNSTESNIISMSTADFLSYLKDKRINRCFFAWNEEEQKIVGSHSELKDIEDWLNSKGNVHYKRHEAIFLSLGMRTNCLLGAFLWNVNRGQAVSTFTYNSVNLFKVY